MARDFIMSDEQRIKGQRQNDILNFEYEKGVQKVFPAHWMVKNWLFTEHEHAEATLANSLAIVAEKNGLSANDMHHLFPYILRMLRSDIQWAGQKETTP